MNSIMKFGRSPMMRGSVYSRYMLDDLDVSVTAYKIIDKLGEFCELIEYNELKSNEDGADCILIKAKLVKYLDKHDISVEARVRKDGLITLRAVIEEELKEDILNKLNKLNGLYSIQSWYIDNNKLVSKTVIFPDKNIFVLGLMLEKFLKVTSVEYDKLVNK